MREKRYVPSLTYYLMALPLFAAIAYACGLALGVWSSSGDVRAKAYLYGVFALVLPILLLLSWRRFLPRRDGLAVSDVRGRKLHPWETLSKPTTKEFTHGSRASLLMDMDGMRGQTAPQALIHYIRDDRGRTLYRVGPWYGKRRELMREIRRCLRESG